MALVVTISGMEIDMLGSILETRSMVSECITLPMGIATKDHGTKAASKAMECTHSEMAARKTADNKVHLRWVDEKVDRAVDAANKATTAARVAAVKAVQNRIHRKFCETNS